MEYVDLKTLPDDHPLREMLLVDAKAEFKHRSAEDWTAVRPGGGQMAGFTYNEMSEQWTRFVEWRAPRPT